MSAPMKLSLLALISSAVASPHYGGYGSRHHRPSNVYGTGSSGRPTSYPTTGNYWGSNSTQVVLPTGSGAVPSEVNDKTTTLEETLYSTQTVVSTIYATRPAGGDSPSGGEYGSVAPSSVGAADFSTEAAACGPATVTVTATNQVTITVGGGEGAPSSSSPAEAGVSAPVSAPSSNGGYGGEATPASATSAKYSVPHNPVDAVQPTEDVYSILPVTSSKAVETPVSSPAASEPAASSVVESATATSSSATQTSTGSPSYSGGKRGLAYNDVSLCSAFDGGSFGWAHNWGNAPGGDLPEGVTFFPTCHRPALYEGEEGAKEWFAAVDTAVKGGSTAVLGFNEPDEPTQFPLDVSTACTEWKRLMNPIAESHPDLTILSLSVTNGGEENKGLKYLKNWVDTCSDAVFHAINIHFYDNYDEGIIDRLQAHVEEASKTFNKPVYVGEYGCNKGTASDEQIGTFIKDSLAYFDSASEVAGYSYFMVGEEQYQLNTASGLSSAGKAYSSS